ncbi:MAG: NAD(P)H-hydrate dehydratase [Desulfobacterales bacterium]|jgi:NAD(P)H-hydrate epimerase
MYLTTAAEMREMDRRTIEAFGLPGRVLMENAGRGAVRFFLECFGDLQGKSVAVVAGRGNNGGDGFVMARYLHGEGVKVAVYLLSERGRVQGDALTNLDLLEPLGIPVAEIPDAEAFDSHRSAISHHHVFIDAILGTGLASDVSGYFKQVIDRINDTGRPIFSVDIPSGLDSDTGRICGTCIRAAATATFGFAKCGHRIQPGTEHTGRLCVVDIGIPLHIVSAVGPRQQLLTPQSVRGFLPHRPVDAHKGTTGHLLVVAGSPGKTGAAAMASLSAMRTGAGLVTLAVPKSLNPVLEPQVTEVMTSPLPETVDGTLDEKALDRILSLAADKRCLALGPGIGTGEETRRLVQQLVVRSPAPLVIDADGLNCLAEDTTMLGQARAPVVLTPHPGEMARLSGNSARQIQADRIGCARAFAQANGVFLVLKGAATVVAAPNGRCWVNPTGNPGMASGGMGDVLTGLIAGLITQGVSPLAASCAGVFLHGRAADALAEEIGPFGYLASDVMTEIPVQIREMLEGSFPVSGSWPVTGVP